MNRRTFFCGRGCSWIPLLEPLRAVAAEARRVRITDVESFRVRIPGGDPREEEVYTYGVSRVHTDAGVTGTSFVPCPNDILQRWVKPTLVGQDLFAVDRHIDRLQMERGESGVQIWSGVEHAMWDAIGRIAGRPVAKLLGGARDKLRVYRTRPSFAGAARSRIKIRRRAVRNQAKFAVRLKQTGFTANQDSRLASEAAWTMSIWWESCAPPSVPTSTSCSTARLCGPAGFGITRRRCKVCRGLEKHKAYWLEEPFDGHDIYGPARLAAEVDILITGGELAQEHLRVPGVPHQQNL